ncbi:MAG: acyl-CoA dehydrogenase family protein [Acidimicrobiales bacterium]|nr:acyl-CoA dehydrogenase family protein [Acidimicrobiales bacterium]
MSESLDEFRARARAYIRQHIPEGVDSYTMGSDSDEEELEDVARSRELQRLLHDGGLTGILVPEQYGGQGLTAAHSEVLNEEMAGRRHPFRLQVPTMTPCMTVILEFGTEEQKKKHIPAILRGDEIWMQMLSEPGGGSDVAGAQTRADRDGDEWVLNGSKIWTTGAWWADWALCLARTNWDVPKHRGLSVFMVPFDAEGVEMHRIELLNGSKEFCQEFLTDVHIPDSCRIGDVDDGWTVGRRWMFYERSFGSSPHTLRPAGGTMATFGELYDLAHEAGRADDTQARELVGEARALALAMGQLAERIPAAVTSGRMNDQAASVIRLMGCRVGRRLSTIRWELLGSMAGAWTDDDDDLGRWAEAFLSRQVSEIGGGTTEMARNVVSERVLGLPRERTPDQGVPFRDVPMGPPSR